MEVRTGYKQTEVGVIPAEWSVRHLAQVSLKITDGDHVTPKRASDGYFLLSARNVLNGRIDVCDVDYVGAAEYRRMKQRCGPEAGDILISCSGTIGRVAVVPSDFECVLVRSAALAKIDHELADSVFLQFWLQGSQAQAQIASSVNQGAQPNLFLNHIERLACPHPPLPEQRAIAAALSDVDALLGRLDRLIGKKRDLKQAVMQQLLTGQTRLPGFRGDWEVKTLFNLAERKKELFDDGDWIESEHITTEGIRLIQTGNIGVGSFVEREVKKYIYEQSFSLLRCKQLKIGDLLVCRLADPAGRACVLPDIGEERIVTSVDVTIFRPSLEIADRVFLSNVFSTPEWFRAVSDRSGGTTHKRISRGALGGIAIKLPPRDEQSAIAAVLSDMDAELAALETRRNKTQELKQGMMQVLLTGKTRLVPTGRAHA